MKPSFCGRTSSHQEDDEHFDCGMWVDVGARQAPGLAFSLPSVRLHQLLRVVTEHPHKQALVEQSCCRLKYNARY
jgi:hypothetical protein